LENSEARADKKAAELQKAKALLKLKILERQIAIEIADRVRDCNVFQEVAINSQAIAKLQKEKLSEEIKRFHYGRSDTDTIIRFQEDFVQAENKVASSIHQYHTALVELKQKEGKLLKEYWNEEL
jgi:outer membrane protein TolC